jgi:predicted N-acetyltransferase YhbS
MDTRRRQQLLEKLARMARMPAEKRFGDAPACGRICYEAFRTLAGYHRFPPDFPSPEHAAETLGRLLAHPRFYSVVAELDGRVVGSNLLDERSTIAGLGPITVDPGVQNAGVGRRLMLAALERASTGDGSRATRRGSPSSRTRSERPTRTSRR